MSQSIHQSCEECGASLGDHASPLTWEGRNLRGECFIKLSVNPEGRLAQCGGRCERCGAELTESGAVFLIKGGVLCPACNESDIIAIWHKKKLPGTPDACERCGQSLEGSDVAFLWLSHALCFECHDKVRQAHPELTQFQLLPLVDLQPGPVDVREFPKWIPDDQSKFVN